MWGARPETEALLRVSMGQWMAATLSPVSALMRTEADGLCTVSGSLQTELPKQHLNAFSTEDFKSHVVSGGWGQQLLTVCTTGSCECPDNATSLPHRKRQCSTEEEIRGEGVS